MSNLATPVPLGTYGVWVRETDVTPDLASAVEAQGYGALWLGGSSGAILDGPRLALEATETLAVATGIVNIWTSRPEETAAS